jgi:hypothetical protein
MSGEVSTSESQWGAFIKAESADLDDEGWWQWDGPRSSSPAFSYLCLGMWFGHPDGLQEFTDLVEAALCVLQREHRINFDAFEDCYLEVPFRFSSVNDWINTLHSWAFRFQMPLLRHDTRAWGTADNDRRDFFELGGEYGQLDGISYPTHPLRFTLIDNVFTSSMTAIRAFLEPNDVIGTLNPWPSTVGKRGDDDEHDLAPLPSTAGKNDDNDEHDLDACHRLQELPTGWAIFPAGSQTPIFSKYSGLYRIAVLIEREGQDMLAEDLLDYGARPFRSQGKAADYEGANVEHGMTERRKVGGRESSSGEEDLHEVGEALQKVMEEQKEAERRSDDVEYERTRKVIAEILDEYEVIKGKVRRRRKRQTKEEKNAYDTVRKTIEKAIQDVTLQSTELGQELDKQIHFPELVFRSEPGCTPWRVLRIR